MIWLFACLVVSVAGLLFALFEGRWGAAVLCAVLIFGCSVLLVSVVAERRRAARAGALEVQP